MPKPLIYQTSEVFAELKELPKGITFPVNLRDKINFDSKRSLLIFKGRMSNNEKTTLENLNTDNAYKAAIDYLYTRSTKEWLFNPNDGGLKDISLNDFDSVLYNFENLSNSGVPSLFSHPFVFSKNLERDDVVANEQFSILTKGVFLGIIEPTSILIANLVTLGKVMQGFLQEMDKFVILKRDGNVIGGIYPECLVFPSAQITDETFENLKIEITASETRFGIDKIKTCFKQWVLSVTNPWPAPTRANIPLWGRKLLGMIERGGSWDADAIDTALLPPLGNNTLHLLKVLYVNDIELVCYQEARIICNKKRGGTSVTLSDKAVELVLGPGGQISCDVDVCGNDCGSGRQGPSIDKVGFFERANDKYIIWNNETFGVHTRPKGCTSVEYHKGEGYAIFTFGRLKIKVKGTVVNKDEIFCEKFVKFKGDVKDATGKVIHREKCPDLPIRSEYLDCIDGASVNRNQYTVSLKGLGKVTYDPTSRFFDADSSSILLWPSKSFPRWKVNYAYFWPGANFLGHSPSIKIIDESGSKYELKGRAGIKTDSPITYVEVFSEGKNPSGIFKVNRKESGGTGAAVTMCLDFGTNNSIFAIMDPGGSITPLKLEDGGLDLLGFHVDIEPIFKGARWLPSYVPNDNPSPTWVPSEIIFTNKENRNTLDDSLKLPISKYTIPHPGYSRESAHLEIMSEFKWDGGNAGFSPVRAYLKLLMHMALAVVRGSTNSVNFTATYPLAFGSDKYNKYKTLLIDLIGALEKETGMTIQMLSPWGDNQVELIPESHAGKAGYGGDVYHLVVDIGGGTTDIALSWGNRILAVDSIHFGGQKYVSYLAEKIPKSLLPKAAKLDSRMKKIIINREIRQYKFGEGVINKYGPEETTAEVLKKLKLFYKALFKYLRMLLEAIPDLLQAKHNNTTKPEELVALKAEIEKVKHQKPAVIIHTVGFGWRFIEDRDIINKIDPSISRDGTLSTRDYIKNQLDSDQYTLTVNSDPLSKKEAIAEGGLETIHLGNLEHIEFLHPVRSVAGCSARITYEDKTIQIEKDTPIPMLLNIPNNVSSNNVMITVEDSSFDFLKGQVSTDTGIIRLLAQRTGGSAIKEALKSDNNNYWLVESLFAVFLEDVFQEKLLTWHNNQR